jgi:class 3 adenylate cyclase/tetratricopeptide (TPR) repeat protein
VTHVDVCSTCGTATGPDDGFCRSCGAELGPAPPASSEARRIVTILFTDVTGFTSMGEGLDPESLRRIMARYFSEMRSVLERHGATIEKFIGDAIMAVFGSPISHEDDALRAVRAAVEMGGALEELNEELLDTWGVTIEMRTGLNTGEVLAAHGDVQQSLVVGDAVNVAARFEQAAEPGTVLIGDTTFRLVRDAVVVEQVGPLTLKGKAEPVPAWRVIEVRSSVAGWDRRLDSALVGRETELGLIREVFDAVVAHPACRVVTILGGAGIGKSRLTAEFLREVAGDARVALGSCVPYGEGITFRPVTQILRDIAGLSQSDPVDGAAARIAMLLEPAEDAAVVGDRLAGLIEADERAPASIQETFWAFRRLLTEIASRQPLVVVIDDIQWAEPTMLDLIEYLTDWTGSVPVMFVCMARPELLDVRAGWLETRNNASLLQLEPLPPAGIDTLIGNLVGEAELADEARARMVEVAEGNPLFVEEILRMLVDDGLLQLEGDRWVVAGDLSRSFIPPTIHALIVARLDRLNLEERAVIERASVAGREFWWGAVTELAPPGLRDQVGPILQSLSRKELIRPGYSNLIGEDAFEFTHVLIGDTTYGAIPKETRADLHERLANWIEQRIGGAALDQDELVGYHLERAHTARRELGPPSERTRDLGRRAAGILAAAGRRAFTRGDMPAAVNLLSRAAGLLPDGEPQRVEVLPRLAFALMEAGDFERLMPVVAETQAAAEALGDPRMLAHATILELYIRLFTSPESWADEAERAARSAIATFERAGDHVGLATGWSLLGLVNVTNGRFATAGEAWEQAAEHAAIAGEERDHLDALAWVLLTLWAGPAPVEQGLQRSLEVLEQAGTNHKGRASAMFMRAVFEAARGDVDTARELIDRARALLEDVALTVWMAGPLTQMAGVVELSAGDPAAAERHLRWGYETLSEVGEMAWQHTLIALLAEAVREQERYDEAEELARKAEEMAGGEDVWSQVLWRGVVARVRARRGEVEAAEDLIREALALVDDTDSIELEGMALLACADIREVAGRHAEAAEAAEAAMRLFERKGDVLAVRRAARGTDLTV